MRSKDTASLSDRLSEQAKARQALLERAKAKSPVNDPGFAERQEARRLAAEERDRRAAERKDRPAPEPDHAPEHGPGRPKTRQGVVVSAKGDKTITVKIDVVQRHRRYHKIMRSTQKLYAHDEANNANEGDTVRVVECRPMSRTKRWRLTDVLERAK